MPHSKRSAGFLAGEIRLLKVTELAGGFVVRRYGLHDDEWDRVKE
jgi:hypothetical protein